MSAIILNGTTCNGTPNGGGNPCRPSAIALGITRPGITLVAANGTRNRV